MNEGGNRQLLIKPVYPILPRTGDDLGGIIDHFRPLVLIIKLRPLHGKGLHRLGTVLHQDVEHRGGFRADVEHCVVVGEIILALHRDPDLTAVPYHIVMIDIIAGLVIGTNTDPSLASSTTVTLGLTPMHPVVAHDTTTGEGPASVNQRHILAGETAVTDVVVFDDAVSRLIDQKGASRIEEQVMAGNIAARRDIRVRNRPRGRRILDGVEPVDPEMGTGRKLKRGIDQRAKPVHIMNNAVLHRIVISHDHQAEIVGIGDGTVAHRVVIPDHLGEDRLGAVLVILGNRAGIARKEQFTPLHQGAAAILQAEGRAKEIDPGDLQIVPALCHEGVITHLVVHIKR